MNPINEIKEYFKDKKIYAVQWSSVKKFFKTHKEAESFIMKMFENEPMYEKPLYVVHHLLFGIDLAVCKTCGKTLPWSKKANKFCSKKCTFDNKEIIEKRKDTVKERYGSEFYFQSKKFKEARKNTMIERYGVDDPWKNEELKERTKKKNLEKYGVEYYSQTEEFKEKRTKTWLEKYKNTSPMKTEEVLKKREKTCLEKYGSRNAMTASRWKTILSWKDYVVPLFSQEDLSSNPNKIYKWKCTKCGKKFSQKIYNTSHLLEVGEQVPRCLNCYPFDLPYSKKEKEVLEYVKSIYNEEILENDRKQIHPMELDIFIPKLKLAIEFDGKFWHQEGVKCPIGYHERKNARCLNKGITIFHVKEEDWDTRKEEVKYEIKNLIQALTLN